MGCSAPLSLSSLQLFEHNYNNPKNEISTNLWFLAENQSIFTLSANMDSERAIAQLVVPIVFGAVAIVLVILRLICRPLSKPSLGFDDYMIVIALVLRSDIAPSTTEKLIAHRFSYYARLERE